ncbi:hypothetical protein [Pseudofulvibacter geojedonensis]|uniref:Uncharacterized protein n=1 Tax=Pseudofulvibacter geojedonensis TaxID=1123758 RepID=A0ABW3I4B9_9FLAO
MVYKFNAQGIDENTDTYLEFSTEEDRLMIISGDYDNELQNNIHYLNKEEINDLIIALTNLNNEIAEFERQTK